MDEIGNIKIEEDTSGDFSPENFEGFIPDEDLDVPEDIEMPDEFELDNMKFDSEEDDDL